MVAGDEIRHVIEANLALSSAIFPRGPWHAVDDAGGLILSERGRPALTKPEQAFSAVASHSRQYAGHDVRSDRGIGRRFKKEVDRGALVPDWRAIDDADPVMVLSPLHEQVKVAGCDQRSAGSQGFAVNGLADFERAQLIEAIREGFRENGRDMLHNRNRRKPGGKMRKHLAQGFSAAGGGAEED